MSPDYEFLPDTSADFPASVTAERNPEFRASDFAVFGVVCAATVGWLIYSRYLRQRRSDD